MSSINNFHLNLLFIYLYIDLTCQNINSNKKENIISNIPEHIDIHFFNSNFTKKNLIFGIIDNYKLATVLPFFESLIKSNFQNCDIVVFVRYVNKILISYLKKIGVIVIEIPKKYIKISTINIRWKMYIDFLEKNKGTYNLVLHADIRDTFFQKDIFKYYLNHKPFLGVALEDGTLIQEVNKKWIIDYVGEEKHKIIQNEKIICVGTMWGSSDKFLEFAKIFWEKLIENPKAIEQGISNYMFYYEKYFYNCLVKSDNYGPVMTIGLTNHENIRIDSQDNILNFKEQIAAVIHQYDRKPDIVNKVLHKYCPELYYIKRKSIITKLIIQIYIIILLYKTKITFKKTFINKIRKYKNIKLINYLFSYI